jgi:hypothetical protein
LQVGSTDNNACEEICPVSLGTSSKLYRFNWALNQTFLGIHEPVTLFRFPPLACHAWIRAVQLSSLGQTMRNPQLAQLNNRFIRLGWLERIRLLNVCAELELVLAVSCCGAAAWVLAHVVGVQELPPITT